MFESIKKLFGKKKTCNLNPGSYVGCALVYISNEMTNAFIKGNKRVSKETVDSIMAECVKRFPEVTVSMRLKTPFMAEFKVTFKEIGYSSFTSCFVDEYRNPNL